MVSSMADFDRDDDPRDKAEQDSVPGRLPGGSRDLRQDLAEAPPLEFDYSFLEETRVAREAAKTASDHDAELDQEAQREAERDLEQASRLAQRQGGGAGGEAAGAGGAGSSAPSAVAPSTQEVHPQNDADEDDGSAAADESAEPEPAPVEEVEPSAAPQDEPASQPEPAAVDEELEEPAEDPVLSRHPLAGRVIPFEELTARSGGAQVRVPGSLVKVLRELLAHEGHEELAKSGQHKIITAFSAASAGVALDGADEGTQRLVEVFRSINPVLAGIETRMQVMVEENDRLSREVRLMRKNMDYLVSLAMTTEMSVSYLVAHSTADLPTRGVVPENVDVAQPRVLELRDRARKQTEVISRMETDKKGRPIR